MGTTYGVPLRVRAAGILVEARATLRAITRVATGQPDLLLLAAMLGVLLLSGCDLPPDGRALVGITWAVGATDIEAIQPAP